MTMNQVFLWPALILSAMPSCTSRVGVNSTGSADAQPQINSGSNQTVAPVQAVSDLVRLDKIEDVPPAYPSDARTNRVQGTVIVEATIDSDGRVKNARIIRSIPLLDQAALDAVRQWRYKPMELNGVAIPVVVTLAV